MNQLNYAVLMEIPETGSRRLRVVRTVPGYVNSAYLRALIDLRVIAEFSKNYDTETNLTTIELVFEITSTSVSGCD